MIPTERFRTPDEEFSRERLAEAERYPILNVPLQQRYDRIAAVWDSAVYEGTRRDDLIPELLRIGDVRDGMVVLEAMCGTGQFIHAVRRTYPSCRTAALDFSRGMLNAVLSGIEKIQASVIAMPFADGTFDRVVIRSGLFDLPRRQQRSALREVRRICKTDGVCVLQTYFTTPETHEALNKIVNLKDLLAGQYEEMGKEYPRYFATSEELEEWMRAEGFTFERVQPFEGTIRYLQTSEMPEVGKEVWRKFVDGLPEATRSAIQLRVEPDGSLVFSFPGSVYRCRPAT